MAVSYNTLLRQLATTLNAFGDATTPSALNAVYDSVPLTEGNFTAQTGSAMFSFNFMKDKILNAQEGLIFAIASTADHPFREVLLSATDPLAYGDLIGTDSAGLPVIGVYGAVYDEDDSEPCTLNEIEIIRLRHQASWMVLSVYEYAILDKRIYHTRADVIVDVCAYDRPDTDALDLTDNIILPDVLGEAIVDGAVAMCFTDDEYLEQGGRGGQLYSAWIAAIKGGQTAPQSNPTPDAQKAYA